MNMTHDTTAADPEFKHNSSFFDYGKFLFAPARPPKTHKTTSNQFVRCVYLRSDARQPSTTILANTMKTVTVATALLALVATVSGTL